jgi:hypothetical protein
MLLPGADSGMLVFPFLGGPYAEYYFKPVKTKEQAGQKIANLKSAVETAIGKKLYEKTENSTLKNFITYKTYFFTSPTTEMTLLADFESSVYEENGMYKVSFQLKGIPEKRVEEKKSMLASELDLNGKLQTFLNASPSYFSSLRGDLKKSDQYVKEYETKMTLFGLKGKVEDRKLECDLKYYISFIELKDLDEANKIFYQLKNALISTLGGSINFGGEEQSKYDAKSFSIQGLDRGADFLQSKNKITLTINRDKDYPAVYLTFNRKKY